jgi:hypothetical protein
LYHKYYLLSKNLCHFSLFVVELNQFHNLILAVFVAKTVLVSIQILYQFFRFYYVNNYIVTKKSIFSVNYNTGFRVYLHGKTCL